MMLTFSCWDSIILTVIDSVIVNSLSLKLFTCDTLIYRVQILIARFLLARSWMNLFRLSFCIAFVQSRLVLIIFLFFIIFSNRSIFIIIIWPLAD